MSEVAIVTGAAGGIGEAIVRALGAQGVAVVGTGRDAARLEALGKALSGTMQFSFIAADLTADDAPGRIVDHTLATFGKVNYLVNNAGAGAWAPVHATSDAMLDEVLAMSLRAPFRLSREVLPHMGMGCAIVTIGSSFGIMGGLDGGIYCAVKAGLTGLTQTMAAQYGGHPLQRGRPNRRENANDRGGLGLSLVSAHQSGAYSLLPRLPSRRRRECSRLPVLSERRIHQRPGPPDRRRLVDNADDQQQVPIDWRGPRRAGVRCCRWPRACALAVSAWRQ